MAGTASKPGSAPEPHSTGKYYAHTAEDVNGNPLPESSGTWQPLAEHLKNVAELAAQFAAPFGASEQAYLAGLLHDLGKYAGRFQDRLRNPNSVHGINHWAAGARRAAELRARLVDYAVDGHHTGLPKASDLKITIQQMATQERFELTKCTECVAHLTSRLGADGLTAHPLSSDPAPAPLAQDAHRFAQALKTRMIFSALADADFLDTERHFDRSAENGRTAQPLQPDRALHVLLAHIASLPADGPMAAPRQRLLNTCLAASESAPGLFTLTAPTGSGKTLSSLAFALSHATHANANPDRSPASQFRRVIVVIPYTSIIDQTAATYRQTFADAFGTDYILEHHSAIAPEDRAQGPDQDAESDRARRARLAAENWSAPIVVTTTVQFFESLFANRPGPCRRLHNIPRSVIIFDEVQTLPPRLLPSLLSALTLLAQEPYGCTAVLMTATQPAFASLGPALPLGWTPTRIDKASAPQTAPDARRTNIRVDPPGVKTDWQGLAATLAQHHQTICVVNTTADARALFRLLPADGRFHLSSRLCPAHRREKLTAIRQRLASGQACRLVSTQLIEAGVDVDFPTAYRAIGPLDSIIQTAGRCNREGRQALPGQVRIFRPAEGHMPPGPYDTAAKFTEGFLNQAHDPDLEDPALYASYFAQLYPLIGHEHAKKDPVYHASTDFDFPTAAEKCKIVSEDTRGILVAWGRGADLIDKLRTVKHLEPPEWRLAQQFSVNLYAREFAKEQAHGSVAEITDGTFRWASNYDDDLGACHPQAEDLCL